MAEENEMNIRIRRATGKDAPRPVAAISMPDPAYGGAKMKTVVLPLESDEFLVDEYVADAIFGDNRVAPAFEISPSSLALPRRLMADEDFMKAWNKRRDAEAKKSSKKSDDENSKSEE